MFSASDGTSHLRRYLTTLGVAVTIGSLSGASLFLRDSALLSFKRSDLSQLTPAAQQTIDRRQHYLLMLTRYLPWMVGIGLLAGMLLLGFGLYGWIRRQQVSDEREDHDLARSRHEIRKLTAEEVQQKQEREADKILELPIRDAESMYFMWEYPNQDGPGQTTSQLGLARTRGATSSYLSSIWSLSYSPS